MKQRVFVLFVGVLFAFFSCSSAEVKIKVLDKSYDFGVVYVNYSQSYDFVLENKTSKAIAIQNLQIDGSQEFFVATGGAGSMIQPKEMHFVKVMFEPVDKGFEQAIMIIVHDASSKPIEIELMGTGETKPEFDVVPTQYLSLIHI